MASPAPLRRRFLAEPIETTTRSSRRRPSDRSDVSPSPSNDSDSTSSSMAVLTRTSPSAEATELSKTHQHKKNVEHVERTQHHDVQMQDTTHEKDQAATNGVLGVNNLRGTDHGDNTAQHKPRRKFAPEPLETSSRSSRKERDDDHVASATTKRKFAPEPLETTFKSSKNKETQQEEEKSSRPIRKFAAVPVETSSTSSRDREKKTDGLEGGARPKRRFAVEPVETSTRSSKEKDDDKEAKPRRRFAVEPVETSASSSRKKKDEPKTDPDEQNDTPSRSSSGGRKFSPELVGTAKASFRKKRAVGSAVPRWLRDEVAEDEGSWSAPEESESKFSAANLAKRARADPRRHSYSIPDLPMIQSDSSEEEMQSPQTPGSISQYNSREKVPRVSKHAHNHEHQKHLDDLKTLREQAVAAYGQQEDHVQFGHYGGDSEDEDYSVSVGKLAIEDNADPSLFRRMSHHDLHLVMEDMRRHHDQLEEAKRDLQEDTAGISRFSAAALAARHHLHISHPVGSACHPKRETRKEQDGDDELAKMRKAASPPMQGNEIKFPFSVSPKMTRCDPDQIPRPRRANSEDEEEHDIGLDGMWSVHVSPTKQPAAAGLWGGLCQKDDTEPTRPATPMRSGLQTPAFEAGNPFESRTPGRGAKTPRKVQPWAGSAFLPLTPPRSKNEKSNDSFTAALDQKLSLERQIDEEFPPRVITQIYNYLSLGYPPLARSFDEELSKISRISMVDLRKGDRSGTGTMKGHIGTPETEGEAEEDEDGRVKGCRRWEALRLYVREWARQSPGFAEQRALPNIGTGMWGNNAPVRKGSWGF